MTSPDNTGVTHHSRRVHRDGAEFAFVGLQRTGADPMAVFAGFPPDPSHVAAQLVFGGCAFKDKALAAMGGARWPVMWVQGDSCSGMHVAGTQALLMNGVDVRRLESGGRIVGTCWSNDDADYCCLAGILPDDATASRTVQTRQVFEAIDDRLGEAGMNFRHVVRTWLFLDHLLDWYGDFNTVRTEFFRKHGVFDHLVPASTGIGAANPEGAALVAGAFAVRPKHAGVSIQAVPSPLQCPALDYRSSFSRAVEIGYAGHRQLIVSGTASIAPNGSSEHLGDVPAQIDLTMRVVQAILESRGMGWDNAVRAVAYFQNIEDAPLLDAYCRSHGIRDLPIVSAHATVCRSDLLFEIEVDALQPRDAR